ncbi:hypothetical protein CYMTET_43605 [Cymbomonas tetramitiformis]|uniref:Uncharacterized protein n=1 Tax=Cymbomonas tetramitiformis TaxID=36881 RepID=A0AAE0F047_9CHLO|nr:hypothetical protein CYMTET_43605 [Cymbomonas tetramitiformis]
MPHCSDWLRRGEHRSCGAPPGCHLAPQRHPQVVLAALALMRHVLRKSRARPAGGFTASPPVYKSLAMGGPVETGDVLLQGAAVEAECAEICTTEAAAAEESLQLLRAQVEQGARSGWKRAEQISAELEEQIQARKEAFEELEEERRSSFEAAESAHGLRAALEAEEEARESAQEALEHEFTVMETLEEENAEMQEALGALHHALQETQGSPAAADQVAELQRLHACSERRSEALHEELCSVEHEVLELADLLQASEQRSTAMQEACHELEAAQNAAAWGTGAGGEQRSTGPPHAHAIDNLKTKLAASERIGKRALKERDRLHAKCAELEKEVGELRDTLQQAEARAFQAVSQDGTGEGPKVPTDVRDEEEIKRSISMDRINIFRQRLAAASQIICDD